MLLNEKQKALCEKYGLQPNHAIRDMPIMLLRGIFRKGRDAFNRLLLENDVSTAIARHYVWALAESKFPSGACERTCS